MNFKEWLLIEDLNFFDTLTPEKYLQMLMADPKGRELVEKMKNVGNELSLLEILDDPLGLYKKATQKTVDPATRENYKKKIELEFLPFIDELKNKNILILLPDYPWFHFRNSIKNPAVQEKAIPNELKNAPLEKQKEYLNNADEGGFRSSKKKMYFSFDNTGPNAIQAMKEITNYFVSNPQFFREAKFPLDASRTESFIFYFSKIGDNYETKIQNDINNILNKLNVKSNIKAKQDLGNKSGNEIEVAILSVKALLPLVPPKTLKKFADKMKSNFEGVIYKRDLSLIKSLPHYPLYHIIVNDPKLKELFTKQGINIDLKSQNQDIKPNTPSSGNELTLASSENNKKQQFKNTDKFGKNPYLLPNSQRFYSSEQFKLFKDPTGWHILPTISTTNSTNLNGTPITSKTKLNNGDVISVGKTQQGKLTVEI